MRELPSRKWLLTVDTALILMGVQAVTLSVMRPNWGVLLVVLVVIVFAGARLLRRLLGHALPFHRGFHAFELLICVLWSLQGIIVGLNGYAADRHILWLLSASLASLTLGLLSGGFLRYGRRPTPTA